MCDAVTANLTLVNPESDFQRISIQEKLQGSQRPEIRIFIDNYIEKFKDKITYINWNNLWNHECGNVNCSECYNYIKKDQLRLISVGVYVKKTP